jgi:hypothetical protein
MQIRYAACHTQHMQKALEQMNVKLTEVVADITGLTGQRIMAAILQGERDPQKLAHLRDPKCKNSAATIAKALEGTWRPEHLFELPRHRSTAITAPRKPGPAAASATRMRPSASRAMPRRSGGTIG